MNVFRCSAVRPTCREIGATVVKDKRINPRHDIILLVIYRSSSMQAVLESKVASHTLVELDRKAAKTFIHYQRTFNSYFANTQTLRPTFSSLSQRNATSAYQILNIPVSSLRLTQLPIVITSQ